MQAIRFHTIGSPEVLKLEEVEKPRPGFLNLFELQYFGAANGVKTDGLHS